jgi:DNA mismatch repair protein MLH3
MNNKINLASSLDMQTSSTAILPLPANVTCQITSSTIITSLNAVVLGLLENSLDAQATRIDISVNLRRGACAVEDDGLGILPSDFRESGGLGRMYHTSRRKDDAGFQVHGGQGTFLASVGALSLLTITSRHFQHYSHNTLIIHRAKPISRLTPAPPQHEMRGVATHGTRVSVRDLFGNMPVRVKQRDINAEEGSEVERQWQALKVSVVGLLLPWDNRVTVKITDVDNPTRYLHINTGAHFISNALSERNLNTLNEKKPGFDQSTILSILSQSGIISNDSKSSWVPVSASTLSVAVKGLISLNPAPSRASQFISIGITPCLDEHRRNELYETVNRIFHQSNFGVVDDDAELDEAELKRRQHDRRFKRDGFTNKQIRGGRKGVDRWPMFYFRIELKTGSSVSKLNDMHLKGVINVLESLTIHWLEANKFQLKNPRHNKRKANPETEYLEPGLTVPTLASTIEENERYLRPTRQSSSVPGTTLNVIDEPGTSSKRARLGPVTTNARSAALFTDWSRIKSARPQMYERMWECKVPQSVRESAGQRRAETVSEQHTPIRVETIYANQSGLGHDMSSKSPELQEPAHHQAAPLLDRNGEAYIEWIDPKTNQTHRINARTGVVMPDERSQLANTPLTSRAVASADTRLSSFGKPLLLAHRKNTSFTTPDSPPNTADKPTWLGGFLQQWQNPTFVNPLEQPIATAGFGKQGPEKLTSHGCHGHCAMTESFSRAGLTDTSRLSKVALPYAEVISQVDGKFILMQIPNLSGPRPEVLHHARRLLVLVDQHAVSERCILEALLEELCTSSRGTALPVSNLGLTSSILTSSLETAILFQVAAQEGAMFRTYAEHFAAWGILYDIYTDNAGPPRLKLLTLPPGISERCKAEPKLIMELVRSEIYTLSETSGKRTHVGASDSSTGADEKHAWLRHMGSCPKGILQLLNSRACRSAIMFNDKLSVEQCQRLVQKVATCAFPFMCAHGRNSMVPLVYLDGSDDGEVEKRRLNGFGRVEKQEEGFAGAYSRWQKKRKSKVGE